MTSQTSSEEEMKDIDTVKPTVMFGSRAGSKASVFSHCSGAPRILRVRDRRSERKENCL